MFRRFILPELAIATGDIYRSSAELTQDEAICFEGLKFITNPSDDQSLLPKGSDSSTVYVGMAHSGLPSLHAIFEESPKDDDLASSDGGSSSFPISWECNVVASAIPIATMPPLEETPMLQTTPAVPQWNAIPQPDIELLPK
jgi:hypothetical protein